jgi:hypothetical protein
VKIFDKFGGHPVLYARIIFQFEVTVEIYLPAPDVNLVAVDFFYDLLNLGFHFWPLQSPIITQYLGFGEAKKPSTKNNKMPIL